jgi:hypothetical protein
LVSLPVGKSAACLPHPWGCERHLPRYLAEFDFRTNNRVGLGANDDARAERAIKALRASGWGIKDLAQPETRAFREGRKRLRLVYDLLGY